MHNRPIVRACDDSVVRLTRGRAGILRRARGYAPLGIRVAHSLPPVLAVGGHLKNTVAIAVGHDVFLSQHIGDLETRRSSRRFRKSHRRPVPPLQLSSRRRSSAICILITLRRTGPRSPACPSFACSTIRRTWPPALPKITSSDLISASHGTAPATASTARSGAENSFMSEDHRFERIAHLRPFGLPGGDAAVREGWRSAASLLSSYKKRESS